MTETRNADTHEIGTAQQSGLTRMDNIDAMLQGRYSQEPFLPWLAKRIRNVFPK